MQTPQKKLRLWPGVLAASLLLIVQVGIPLVVPNTTGYAVLGGAAGGLLVILWWLFFSRAPWVERLGAIALMAAGLAVTSRLVHESIATGGMGFLFFIYAIPAMSLALVVAVVATRHLSREARRAAIVAGILLVCVGFTLIRTGGITSDANSDLAWRWSQTPEERLITQAEKEAVSTPSVPAVVEAGAEWSGFRGPHRDGVLPGATIETDWSRSPPVALWRRPIGPGWSSFAVQGDLLYTQEQRGEEEMVACYDATTGEPVWKHSDTARFWESNAGAGPRGTPTLSGGRVYTFGATGIVNALDARTGAVAWSRNAAAETGATTPTWGFSSSPLVVDDLLIVAVSGQLVGYDLATGDQRWAGPAGGASYSSPHLVTIDGVVQVLLLSKTGLTSVTPADGKVLWEHPWTGYPIVQPALTPEGDVLISVTESSGTRRLAVAHEAGNWKVEERWTSIGLKPYFSDFVIHDGHAYGFDGSILACIDVANGERKWKGGRYGSGQLILLPDQDLLLVLSEKGELALIKATPDGFTEVARAPGIEGKTWNHPVLSGDTLLVRNDQEMAAFRLSSSRG